MKNIKLGIIGYGFVGQATDWGFNKNVDKFIVDPKLNKNIDDLIEFNPDLVFICVPTPMNSEGGQDSEIIKEVVCELESKMKSVLKVIKSTVLPSIIEELYKIDKKIVYNPEFLREKHAKEDFAGSEMIILGGEKNNSKKVAKFYKDHSRCTTNKYFFLGIKTASFVKYSINTFLASKVIFFNELYGLFENLNVDDDWENVVNIISTDKRIGNSHMSVPGHDKRKGFGGACLPKDSMALLKFADDNKINLSVLRTVIKTNNKIRSQYMDLDIRESEQNITFDDKI